MSAYPILAFLVVMSKITHFDEENNTFKINFRAKYFQDRFSTVNLL